MHWLDQQRPATKEALVTRLLPILVAAVLAGAIAGGVVGRLLGGEGAVASTREAGKSVSSTRPARDTSAAEHVPTASEVYQSAAPGVVVVTDTQTETIPQTIFTPSQRQLVHALGSGFVIDTRGDIVTNEHVVHDAKGIRVGFSSGASFVATIVGMDPSTDIAVVRVKASPSVLQPLAFDDSSAVRVGDPVMRSETRSASTER
jgi:S1-C subfamily serine protease